MNIPLIKEGNSFYNEGGPSRPGATKIDSPTITQRPGAEKEVSSISQRPGTQILEGAIDLRPGAKRIEPATRKPAVGNVAGTSEVTITERPGATRDTTQNPAIGDNLGSGISPTMIIAGVFVLAGIVAGGIYLKNRNKV